MGLLQQSFPPWLKPLVTPLLLGSVRGPLANNQKKTLEMKMNPIVDGYTETLNHRKIARKKQRAENLNIS